MVKNGFSGITKKISHLNTTQRTKLIQKWILYVCTKFGKIWLKNGRQISKMAATKFSFFYISTSDRGDFPHIIDIALYTILLHQFVCRPTRSKSSHVSWYVCSLPSFCKPVVWIFTPLQPFKRSPKVNVSPPITTY